LSKPMLRQSWLPPWQRIAGEPWAKDVILGLAGRFDERLPGPRWPVWLRFMALARLPTPLNVVGWHSVEIDPTWARRRLI
jgi:hypothetical protein